MVCEVSIVCVQARSVILIKELARGAVRISSLLLSYLVHWNELIVCEILILLQVVQSYPNIFFSFLKRVSLFKVRTLNIIDMPHYNEIVKKYVINRDDCDDVRQQPNCAFIGSTKLHEK